MSSQTRNVQFPKEAEQSPLTTRNRLFISLFILVVDIVLIYVAFSYFKILQWPIFTFILEFVPLSHLIVTGIVILFVMLFFLFSILGINGQISCNLKLNENTLIYEEDEITVMELKGPFTFKVEENSVTVSGEDGNLSLSRDEQLLEFLKHNL